MKSRKSVERVSRNSNGYSLSSKFFFVCGFYQYEIMKYRPLNDSDTALVKNYTSVRFQHNSSTDFPRFSLFSLCSRTFTQFACIYLVYFSCLLISVRCLVVRLRVHVCDYYFCITAQYHFTMMTLRIHTTTIYVFI